MSKGRKYFLQRSNVAKPMLFVEIFDIWDIDFMGSFPSSFSFLYILHVVDYISKWVEEKTTRTNDSKVVTNFIRSNIFVHFEISKATSNDRGMPFVIRQSHL